MKTKRLIRKLFAKTYNELFSSVGENLKTRIQKRMTEKGADLNNFKFKFYKASPYQKKRFKPEFVQPECWIYPKGKKEGYVITEEDFNYVTYSDPFLEMILAENRNY